MGTGSARFAPSHEFLEHPGELALAVRAGSFAELIEETGGALAKLHLRGAHGPAEERWEEIRIQSTDRSALLVDWLNELLFRAERDRWIATEFEVLRATTTDLTVRARGVHVEVAPSFVKAATLHDVRVEPVAGGVEAHVVLDI